MDITRAGSQPSGRGPAEYFTGSVRIDPLMKTLEPARVQGASVTFEPGVRTAWHGASPTTAMSHIAIQEALDGKPVDWLEHVSDEQYHDLGHGPPASP